MKCDKCPLYTSYNNESGKEECCALFGPGWDNDLQYGDKDGNIIGCYVDHRYIKKFSNEVGTCWIPESLKHYMDMYDDMLDSKYHVEDILS